MTSKDIKGSDGGASGRAMAFCLSEPGLNPGTELAFFRNAFNLFSLGVGLSLKRTGHKKCYTLFFLLSCFLSFQHCEYIDCIVPIIQREENKNPEIGWERPKFDTSKDPAAQELSK